jgi:hypothetical protein
VWRWHWLPAAAQAERATGGRDDRIFEQEITEISKKRRGFHIEVRFSPRRSHTDCGDDIWLPAAAKAERATVGREDRIFEQEIAEIAKKSRGFQIGFGSSREDQDGIKMLDNNKNNR